MLASKKQNRNTITNVYLCNIQHLEIYEEKEGQLYLLCSFSREVILEQGLQTTVWQG